MYVSDVKYSVLHSIVGAGEGVQDHPRHVDGQARVEEDLPVA